MKSTTTEVQKKTPPVVVDERRRRAIIRAEDTCEGSKCGFVAYSYERWDSMEIRERDGEPDRPYVFCPECTAKHDKKASQRRTL